MKCPNCNTTVPLGGKFCAECGASAFENDEGRSASDVSLDWLQEILEEQNFTVSPSNSDNFTLVANHNTKPTIFVGLNPDLPLITVNIRYSLKKPNWGKKNKFLSAINKANSKNWLCTFFAPDSLEFVTASTAMWIGEKISKRDIVGYLDTFLTGVVSSIEVSGIIEFA